MRHTEDLLQNPICPETTFSDGREPESTDWVTAVLRLPDLTHLANKGRAEKWEESMEMNRLNINNNNAFPSQPF